MLPNPADTALVTFSRLAQIDAEQLMTKRRTNQIEEEPRSV